MSPSPETPPIWRHALFGVLEAVSAIPRWLRLSHVVVPGTKVPNDFFGINVATNQDPKCDDYIVECLQELQLTQVRMSYSYDSVDAPAERLLQRLLEEGYSVLLDLLPSASDARRMHRDTSVQARWGAFVEQTLERYGTQVEAVEIGNTPNRGRWSGHDAPGYLATWRIAAAVAENTQTRLAGPNISDFEPIYNVGFLRAMQLEHSVPSIQTDNLFVERVVQPEAYDHRVAGRFATGTLQLNLVKKARILVDIARTHGIETTWCTYTCWTRKRLSRWHVEPEQKNADYLVRYLIIAAASGVLNRVYWGPLICQRDGLIACGDHNYPKIDNVSYYQEVRGQVENFERSPAFSALGFCTRMLRNATCTFAYSEVGGLNHYSFEDAKGSVWHAVWCMDQGQFSLHELYEPELLTNATIQGPDGQELEATMLSISERPLILSWSGDRVAPRSKAQLNAIRSSAVPDTAHWVRPQWDTQTLQTSAWRGVYLQPKVQSEDTPTAAQIPTLLASLPETKVLRDKRNRLWNIEAPWWSEGEQTVKLNRAKGLKKLSYRLLPSKGKRHWNNATKLLRLGISTPQPLGFFEQPSNNALDSYYICQYINNAYSCRNLFTAFAEGATEYRGIDKNSWLVQIAAFIANMHRFGVIHRDLSSGNLMMTSENEEVHFFLIDIGRAKIDKKQAAAQRMRFKDLNRICYKLNWRDRETLINAYAERSGTRLPGWWRLSLSSYDWKQNSKKFLKGRKRTAKPKATA